MTHDLLFKVQEILNERQKDYGNSNQMLEVISDYWTTYLKQQTNHSDNGLEYITSYDVCIMMLLMKIAREGYNPKKDNRTDIIGYTCLLDDLYKEVTI